MTVPERSLLAATASKSNEHAIENGDTGNPRGPIRHESFDYIVEIKRPRSPSLAP